MLVFAGCASKPEQAPAFDGPPRVLGVARDDGTVEQFVLAPGAGLIVGSVRTAGGAALAGIHMSLLKTDEMEVTSATGQFSFTNLAAGEYELRADAKGFRAAEERIKVPPGVVTRVQITMLPAERGDSAPALGDPMAPVKAHPQDGAAANVPRIVYSPWAGIIYGVLATILATAVWAFWSRQPGRLVARGEKHLGAGRAADAERLARRALARDASHSQAWFLLGASLIKKRSYAEAVRLLEEASAKHDPHVAGFAFLITLAHQRLGQPEKARRWLPIVARDPGFWDALEHDPDTAFKTWTARVRPPKPRGDPAYA